MNAEKNNAISLGSHINLAYSRAMALTQQASEKARKPADRWTPKLVKDGWTPVALFFLNNYHRLQIKPSEAMFIIHLMSFKWDKAAPYPGFKIIARRMSVTPEAVRLLARSLEKKGFLYRQKQVGTTNKFHLDGLFAALEKMLAEDEVRDLTEEHKEQLHAAGWLLSHIRPTKDGGPNSLANVTAEKNGGIDEMEAGS